jgi:hypothetical protein
MNSTQVAQYISRHALAMIGTGAVIPRGMFGFQSYTRTSPIAYENIVKMKLDSGQRINYNTKLELFLTMLGKITIHLIIVGSLSNQKPENEDCGKDATKSICFQGNYKVNLSIRCFDGSAFSLVHYMPNRRHSGESTILQILSGALGSSWRFRNEQNVADAAGFMAHIFECRDRQIMNAGNEALFGYYEEIDASGNLVDQGDPLASELRLGGWEIYTRAEIMDYMRLNLLRFFGAR